MPKRFRYILLLLLFLIVYEVYLILLYTYQDFQINSYMDNMQSKNDTISTDIKIKEQHLASIKTNAFADKIAKMAENKKNPGEDVVFFITQKQANEYTKTPDTIAQIEENTQKIPQKTAGMTNPQKWTYYLFGVDLR